MLNKHYLQNVGIPKSNQQGAALIAMMAILVIVLTTVSIQFFNRSNLRNLKTQKTQQALALAKQALLAYASEEITPNSRNPTQLRCNDKNGDGIINSQDSPYIPANCNCGFNCPRPGELPCPDTDDDGEAQAACGSNQNFRLGRLPWKTLGIDDLRDGSGERLWYAVSNNYKSYPRVLPLNSQTLGTITLKNSQGNFIHDATNAVGLVAVIIAPNEILTRADNLQQNRESQNINDAKHFLDIAFGEDNATFVENTTDGFISGIVKQNNNIVINDIIMPITKEEINAVIEPRVLVEVMQAILYGFCPNKVNIKSRSCSDVTGYDFFPDPALSSDSSCLSNSQISNSACNSDSGTLLGRIPVGGNANWEVKDVNSILRGQAENNWFQQNGWRELIFYARAPACNEANKNCTGSGYLTLNNAITPTNASSPYNKKVVLISAGNALGTQARTDHTNKKLISNYLEDENISPPDSTFSRYARDENKNDRILSIP